MSKILRAGRWFAARFTFGLSILFLISAIADEPDRERTDDPQLAPLPVRVPAPEDNPTTEAKVALGRQLFFDPRLSGDNTMSCASCHIPAKAYGDGLSLSPGAGGKRLSRHTPTTLNTGFLSVFLWDGRAGSLEEQALGPIESPEEMNQSLDELEKELRAIPGYVRTFQEVFGGPPDRKRVATALAAFQRTLVSQPSPLDRYLRGDKKALSDDARRGLELFEGEAGCIRCHHGPMLTDGRFHRLGVSFRDEGRGRITGREEDRYRFRTPPLRNVADTAPYMHNGSLESLEEVVMFYYRGIPSRAPDGLKPDAEALVGQSFSEMPYLVAFLKSLSGDWPRIEPPPLPSVLHDEPDVLISPATIDERAVRTHVIESPYQSNATKIRVLLPQDQAAESNGDDARAARRFPVVYVLPVEAADERRYGDSVTEVLGLPAELRRQAIFVMPTFADLPWYADHPADPQLQQETYFLRVVVPFVEQTYPALAEPRGRLLLGYSKSGWGAWSLLLRRPDQFGRAAAWDAPMMMDAPGKYGSGPIFGTPENFAKYRISELVRRRAMEFAASREPQEDTLARLLLVGAANFRNEHVAVHQLLEEIHVRHIYVDPPALKHHWNSGWVEPAIRRLLANE